jgi:hypothetical protein
MTEVRALREQVQHLSLKIGEKTGERREPLKERASRRPLHSEIELIGDFDIIEAEGVDISESGICFELRKQLFFDMRFVQNGTLSEKRARLIWVKQTDDGRPRLGFHFEEPATSEEIIQKAEN